MAANVKIVTAKQSDGPVSIVIDASRYPQSVAGVVWRYSKEKKPETKVGIFNSHVDEVQIGNPTDIHEKLFLVKGLVISQDDDPPTNYKVRVQVKQDENVLLDEVPENWSGQLSDTDIALNFRLQIIAS